MSETTHLEVDLPCSTQQAWEHVLDPTWLGDAGEIDPTPGTEGWVEEDGDTRFLLIEEAVEAERLVFRWASYRDEPTRVAIELVPLAEGTRVTITEMPLSARAASLLALR